MFGRSAAAVTTTPRTSFLKLEALAVVLGWAAILALPLLSGLFRAVFTTTVDGDLGPAALGLTGGLLMLPSTFCMGWAFPAALRHMDAIGAGHEGTIVVYGLNTLGAGLGVAVAGFLLVPFLALPTLCMLMLALDLGVLGWAFSSRSTAGGPITTPDSPELTTKPGLDRQDVGLVVAVLIGGAVALASEILLFRVLGLLLGPTARAFTSVVTAYVVGLGLGSLAVRTFLATGRRAETAFVASWAAAGCVLLALHAGVDQIPNPLSSALSGGADFGHQLTVKALVAIVVLLPLTCAFGAAFAAASAIRDGGSRRGSALYAALTLGNIVGLLAAPAVLLPLFDLDGGLACVAVLAFTAALVAAFTLSQAPRSVRYALVVVTFLACARVLSAGEWNWKSMISAPYLYDRREQWSWEEAVVLHHETTLEATVAVVGIESHRLYSLDGKVDGSSQQSDLQTQSFAGILPAVLHPDPHNALVIGLGTGQTAGEMLRRPGLRVDCAELLGAVARSADWFTKWNGDPIGQERFRLWRADGRSILRFAPQTYDIIASEPSNLWVPGVAHLFTYEAFVDARSRLTPGTGIYAQWLHAYGLDEAVVLRVLRTFMEVFPEVSLWTTSLDRQDLLLVGSDAPIEPDLATMTRIIEASRFQDHIRAGRPLTPTSVLRRCVAGQDVLRQAVAGAELVHERDPGLEYVAEQTFRIGRAERAASLHAWLAQMMRQQDRLDASTGGAVSTIDRRRAATVSIRDVLADNRSYDDLTPTQLESQLHDHLAPMVSAYEADPEDASLRLVLSRILQERGREFGRSGAQELGLRLLWRSLQLWPRQESVVGTVVDFLSRTNQFADARKLVDKYEQAEPAGPSHRLRGRLAMAEGDYDEAISNYELVLQEDPTSLNALGNLGVCHRAGGQAAQAEQYFRRILELDPHNGPALVHLTE